MIDFQVIKYDNHRFTAQNFNELHAESLAFLKDELTTDRAQKTIVVTHHVPTLLNYPEKHKGSILNEGFAVELFDLIESTSPDYWIYGHSHGNIADFEIGNTQLLTNQLGYVRFGEHQLFNTEKVIIL